MLDDYVIVELREFFQPFGVLAVAELIAVAQSAYLDGVRRLARKRKSGSEAYRMRVAVMLSSIAAFYGINRKTLRVMFNDAYIQGANYEYEWSRGSDLIIDFSSLTEPTRGLYDLFTPPKKSYRLPPRSYPSGPVKDK